MGDGNDKQANTDRTPGIASQIVTGTFDPTAVVGKRTLTGDTSSPIGDEYMDHEARCERSAGENCFLSKEQRSKLIEDYKIRVSMALGAYMSALNQIGLEKLLTKNSNDLPWIVTLLLDVAGAKALSGLVSALQKLKTEQLTDLGKIVDMDPASARSATATASVTYQGLSAISDEKLAELSKAPFNSGKEKALAAFKAHLNKQAEDEKTQSLSFIAQLKVIATAAFEDLRLKPPGYATDAQLLVLWNGFAPEQHRDDIYKVELEAKLRRYAHSGVTVIGRADGLRPRENEILPPVEVKRDTVVVRVRFKSGYPDKYAYAKHDWALNTQNTLPTERYEQTRLPLDESKWNGHPIADGARYSERPEFERFIDPEFVDVAVERHEEVWGKPPQTIEADDSNWTWDKNRVEKANQTKAKEPLPFGVPRLQLRDIKPKNDEPVAFPDELKLGDEKC